MTHPNDIRFSPAGHLAPPAVASDDEPAPAPGRLLKCQRCCALLTEADARAHANWHTELQRDRHRHRR